MMVFLGYTYALMSLLIRQHAKSISYGISSSLSNKNVQKQTTQDKYIHVLRKILTGMGTPGP